MRIYIIGNDGIALCREAPATVNDGEVAVASKEELHAASLSGKRLLALWNALPGVEKRRTVGARGALIDRLWPAIEDLPDPGRPSTREGDGGCTPDATAAASDQGHLAVEPEHRNRVDECGHPGSPSIERQQWHPSAVTVPLRRGHGQRKRRRPRGAQC